MNSAMNDWSMWALFIAVGVGTFAMRLCFVELQGRLHISPALSRALAYVPPSVLAAIVLPAVVHRNGASAITLDNPQIPAALVAAVVAWLSRSTLLTLAAGMGMLWLLEYFGW
jgi:branched-subunit amino acid transport protein